MQGFVISRELQAAIRRECVNDHAILEVMQAMAYQCQKGQVKDILTQATGEIEEVVNTVDSPTADDLAALADFRRRDKIDCEAEIHFRTMNNMARQICGLKV